MQRKSLSLILGLMGVLTATLSPAVSLAEAPELVAPGGPSPSPRLKALLYLAEQAAEDGAEEGQLEATSGPHSAASPAMGHRRWVICPRPAQATPGQRLLRAAPKTSPPGSFR